MNDASLAADFRAVAPAVEFCSLRFQEEAWERVSVRQDVPEPPHRALDRGAMVTVIDRGGLGYAATSDLSRAGLRTALERACELATMTRGRANAEHAAAAMPRPEGAWRGALTDDPARLTIADRVDYLAAISRDAHVDGRIVDWGADLWSTRVRNRYLVAGGQEAEQTFDYMVGSISATAHADGETQTRTSAGRYNGFCQQGGLEVLERAKFREDGRRVGEQALELVAAPNCPTGSRDLLLMPDQMMLQIHESIGHPLELDRILGDERNFAGTSFVTLDMFGSYRYGSELLDVTFDPTRPEQFASYAYDDEGSPARREYVIKRGILVRPLGGALSQARARAQRPDISGVANARACSWNRPPIDRMGNINVEPGTATLDELIASIDDGVMMQTNASWSIDDSRNKFQFGCEYGRRIRSGRLAEVVKNPNYRGVSANFWRSLSMVGDASTVEVLGTPYCGKGEPAQVIRVGHASPACKFAGVEIFGGEG